LLVPASGTLLPLSPSDIDKERVRVLVCDLGTMIAKGRLKKCCETCRTQGTMYVPIYARRSVNRIKTWKNGDSELRKKWCSVVFLSLLCGDNRVGGMQARTMTNKTTNRRDRFALTERRRSGERITGGGVDTRTLGMLNRSVEAERIRIAVWIWTWGSEIGIWGWVWRTVTVVFDKRVPVVRMRVVALSMVVEL